MASKKKTEKNDQIKNDNKSASSKKSTNKSSSPKPNLVVTKAETKPVKKSEVKAKTSDKEIKTTNTKNTPKKLVDVGKKEKTPAKKAVVAKPVTSQKSKPSGASSKVDISKKSVPAKTTKEIKVEKKAEKEKTTDIAVQKTLSKTKAKEVKLEKKAEKEKIKAKPEVKAPVTPKLKEVETPKKEKKSEKLPDEKKSQSKEKVSTKTEVVKEEEISIVETAPEKPKPTVRYSDEDLELFKEKILEVRKEAIEELGMLKERLEDLTNYDFAEESMIYSMHMAEQGSEAMEKEKTYAQIQRINEYIKKLDEAIQRISEKTYGICRECGILIAKERLLAVPITTLSASWKIRKICPDDGIDRIEPLK